MPVNAMWPSKSSALLIGFGCLWENHGLRSLLPYIILYLEMSSVHVSFDVNKFLFSLVSWTGVFAFQIEDELYLVVACWDSYSNFATPERTCKNYSSYPAARSDMSGKVIDLILFKDCLQGMIFLPSVFSFCSLQYSCPIAFCFG
ncbi:hypothetical protein WN944_011301 [Citrus x changshan-huyou]|uniref:Uncharacterized protein n=1 Tax=Citrus x changshan-huyou TaxID=2935761 RepID=A0AAP0MVN8_9ROSI